MNNNEIKNNNQSILLTMTTFGVRLPAQTPSPEPRDGFYCVSEPRDGVITRATHPHPSVRSTAVGTRTRSLSHPWRPGWSAGDSLVPVPSDGVVRHADRLP